MKPLCLSLITQVGTKVIGIGSRRTLIRRFFSTSLPPSSSSSATTCSLAKQYKVVFMGGDSFSLPSLIELTNLLTPENVSVVVSSENNVVGKYAKKRLRNGQIYLWDDFKTVEFGNKLAAEGHSFDFGVVASFGYLIPARVINRFPL